MADQDPLEGIRKEGRGWKFWLAMTAVAMLAIFVIQNSQDVEVEFLFTTTDTPLFLALLLAGGLGAVIGWATPRIRRGRDQD